MSALIRVTFELAITLKLSHYSVTTFSTKVNANNDVMEAINNNVENSSYAVWQELHSSVS